jgi:hypothetical protein
MRALPFAQETYLRINKEGIMCIQHQVQVAGQNTFVDFLICANTAEDDDFCDLTPQPVAPRHGMDDGGVDGGGGVSHSGGAPEEEEQNLYV